MCFRTEAQWQHMMDTVYWLEDNHKNSSSGEKIFKRQSPSKDDWFHYLPPSVEWYLRCSCVPLLYQGAGVTAGVMSVMITWSEVTFFSERPTLSLFAVFIQAAADDTNYRWIEIISFLTICYMSLCTFFTVFKVFR